jgi:hypothetical protein
MSEIRLEEWSPEKSKDSFNRIQEPVFSVIPQAREFLHEELADFDNVEEWLDEIDQTVLKNDPMLHKAMLFLETVWGVEDQDPHFRFRDGMLMAYRLLEIQADMDKTDVPKLTREGYNGFFIRVISNNRKITSYTRKLCLYQEEENQEFINAIRENFRNPGFFALKRERKLALAGSLALFDMLYGQEKPDSIATFYTLSNS